MWTFKGVPLTGFLTEIKKIWWVPILYLGEPQTKCLCIKFEKKCKIDPPYRTQQTAGTHSPPVPPPPLLQRIVYCRTNIFLSLDSKVVPEEYDWISFSHLQCISNLWQYVYDPSPLPKLSYSLFHSPPSAGFLFLIP